jgi:hypothetical protein
LKKNYFFSEVLSDCCSSLGASATGAASAAGASSLGAASAAGASSLGASTAGATFSSVTVSGFTSTSIPIFFLIFSAILADLPVLSLK